MMADLTTPMSVAVLTFLLSLLLVVCWALSRAQRPLQISKVNHALVTGGSQGIGACVASLLAARGVSHLTILSRDISKLNAIKKEISSAHPSCSVAVISVDVTSASATERAVNQAVEANGPPEVVICAAGGAMPKRFEDAPIEDFERAIKLNYLGVVYVAKAVMPHLKTHKRSHIVFVSSMAGQVGIYGYTSYSPSKFALRGFAEALSMEVRHFGVHVTVAYPPDTDTPGLKNERNTTPEETVALSEGSGMWSPQVVAKKLVDSMARGHTAVNYGIDGLMLGTLTVGMGRASTVLDAIKEVALMGLLRAVALGYVTSFYATVASMARKRAKRA
ncbi:3-ketodihydrosphingosine reductase [Pycnococcus provasolii]